MFFLIIECIMIDNKNMIYPPLTSAQRESQTILHQLVSNYSHSSIPQDFTSLFKKYDTLQKVKYQVFHLQRYIQKNRDSCFDFLKNIMRNQLHKKSKSSFLNIVLILIWMVYQNYSPACTPLNEQGEQSILQDSTYNLSKQQTISQNVSKPSIKQQINNPLSQEKVQNCCSPLNGEGEQSIQLNSIDNQASQNSKVQIDDGPLIKPLASDQKLQNCHIPLNGEGEQSFKEHSHDVQISNELYQIHHGVSIRSQTSSSNCQKQKQIDWTYQISEFIKAKRDLIKNDILKWQEIAENTSYKSFLLKHISRVKSVVEHRQAQMQIVQKYYSLISGNFEKYYSLVQSKQGYEFQPQQYYLFIRNFHEIISFLDKGSNENILDQLSIQSEQNFSPKLFKKINALLLMNIGFYHYLRRQFHKAHYYARWAYQAIPKIKLNKKLSRYVKNIIFLYGVALQGMGQLQEAQKVLKQNLKQEKISSAVHLSLVMAKQGKSSEIKKYLDNAKQQQNKKVKIQQEQYIQTRNGCRETKKILADVKHFYVQVLHVEAYSLIHKQNFKAAINLMRGNTNKDAKKSIYLAWCYFKLEKYKDCEEQILKIKDDSIGYVNPLDYISYLEQFLNFERLSWSSRQRLFVFKQKAVEKLKQISKESLCFARQLFKRKQYRDAYKLLKYIDQNFRSIGKLQLEKQLQIYMWKARVVQFNSSNTKNYSLDEMLRLQRQLQQEGLYEQKAFKLGDAFLNHDRRRAVHIFKKSLQMHMNLQNFKHFLLNLKHSPQDSQNIEQWLEINLHNNNNFFHEIHLQMGHKYKFQKKYMQALKHYEKYKDKYKFQQQQLHKGMLECQFNIAVSQSQQAFIYKTKIYRQLHNKITEMGKSKDKVQPKFIKDLRQMVLIKYQKYKDMSKIAKQERCRLEVILNLLLKTITYNQIQFCTQKLQFVMATPQPELLVGVTFSKPEIKIKFLNLILRFAEFHNLPSYQLTKRTIEMLQRYKIPSDHLLIYYSQVGMYQKVVQSYRKRMNQNDLQALISQLISVSKVGQNALIPLLHAMSMQMTNKKKQTIWQIISKKFFDDSQKSEEISRFKTSLSAILQKLSEYDQSFLAKFTTTIFV